jgi:hypothetical protein
MANLAQLVKVAPETVTALEAKLRSPETSLPEKYRVLFSLRNIEGPAAHEALALGAWDRQGGRAAACAPRRASRRRRRRAPAAWPRRARRLAAPPTDASSRRRTPAPPPPRPSAALKDPSALFRHDVAFCMGQRQDPAAVEVLQGILKDAGEHPM